MLCPSCNSHLILAHTPEGDFLECSNKEHCSYSKRTTNKEVLEGLATAAVCASIPSAPEPYVMKLNPTGKGDFKPLEPIVIPGDKAKSDPTNNGIEQIPLSGLVAIGSIFEEGRLKYGKDNWKNGVNDKEYQTSRLVHAITHLMLYANGDRSENHLAKVAWFCVTQLELERLESCTPNTTPS